VAKDVALVAGGDVRRRVDTTNAARLTVVTDPNRANEARLDERAAARVRDAELVARVRAGDRAAFDGLVHAYMRQAFQLAYRVVSHREDAEDLVQEAFLAAYQYLDSYDATRPFGPWLMRIVLNRGANLRRSRKRRETEPETDAISPAPSALDESERTEAREKLVQALGMLSERQRMIVTMFDVDGLTSTEIGEVLDLSAGTVRWHLHEARRTLRGALSKFFKGEV
jgi:RNA polymerase sigma-70 factor (ECF subfamily)